MFIKNQYVAIGYNTSHHVWIARRNMIQALIAQGHKVTLFAPRDAHTHKIEMLGLRFVEVPMRMNKNPFSDLVLAFRFWRAMRQERPDIFLGYTAKPNIYGTIAARALNIPVVNNIAGLGSTFAQDGLMARIMLVLYRLALNHSGRIFFQNQDDRKLFIDRGILTPKSDIVVLPGSGVDLEHFQPVALPASTAGKIRFLFVARLLWEKGVGEFIEAARIIRLRHPLVEFQMLGGIDNDNPTAVTPEQVRQWQEEGIVTHLGFHEDIRIPVAAADCVVLPSYYREGTPRSLLEAAAMARPIITTDAVGCRDTVDDNISGFLCPPRDAESLADRMQAMIDLPLQERVAMGLAGRRKMEKQFDEKIVLNNYLSAIAELGSASGAGATNSNEDQL
jgi:glycosyltransferase involved in cell wall biosynthesis